MLALVEAYTKIVSNFCGSVNISYPFRLKTQPRSCGFKGFELVCENDRTIFPMKYGNFYVQNISYLYRTIHLLDVNLVKDNCSIPHSSIPVYPTSGLYVDSEMYLVNYRMKMNNSRVYIDASRCTNRSPSPTPPANFFYFLDGGTAPSNFHQSCTVEAQVPIMLSNITGLSTFDIYEMLMMGVHLSFDTYAFTGFLVWNSVVNV
ncbi:uncharacterized protein LOC111276312 [Durio zibethinus]|uniref:Uncharacterized protein LOC111276312 n=1 Tax=Durio zibethinus TaxID=66656 RepID=A0A6P5WNU0_DURZI|nr:uncharacterized protein LOC111276312 [Durio zibethinus]